MRDMGATRDRFGPACIMLEVGGEEFKPVVVDVQPTAHLGLALQVAHRRVDAPAIVDQLPDQEARDITTASGDQCRIRHATSPAGSQGRD
ncbi:hypothetical protein D9M69_685790 [compost metagenome]